jgi:hypothetical protein
VIFNVDSAFVNKAPSNSPLSDQLILFDHPYGKRTGSFSAFGEAVVSLTVTVVDSSSGTPTTRDVTIEGVVEKLRKVAKAAGDTSDVFAVTGLDVSSLALTATKVVSVSGDRTWIGFGEGNKSGAGRVMLVNDPVGPLPGFFSPSVTVTDILDNASEPVFGIALDRTGEMIATHGIQSYFAAINNPFHLRLQGKYDTFDKGAGITFHPNADLRTTSYNSPTNIGFVASSNGTIEVVDASFFTSRGKLGIKGQLYGPLRASLPFPGDPAGTVLKLFGLTSEGLVVIDLTAKDIQSLR